MRDETNGLDPAATPSPSAEMTPARAPYPGIGQAVWLLILVIAATIAIQIPFVFIPTRGFEATQLGVTNLVAFGLIMFWRVRKERLSVRATFPIHGIRPAVVIPVVVATIGLTILLSEFDNLLQTVLPTPEWLRAFFESLATGNLLQTLFVLVLVAPLTEELLFRGVILQGFLARYSAPKAVFWSAFLFAAFHLNPWQFAIAFVLGILFGWLVVQTGSLVPVLIGHAVANGWALILTVLDIEIRGFTYVEPGSFQPWWLTVTGVLLTFGGILILVRVFRTGNGAPHSETFNRDSATALPRP